MRYFSYILRLESAGGLFLFLAAAIALVVANSALAPLYEAFFQQPLGITLGKFELSKPLLLWINDGLMAIFFLLIGLELKQEVLYGHLSSVKLAMLPAIAALGGMLIPAAIFWKLNSGDAEAMRGWAIPVATDIAFAVGVLATFGERVPKALKIFLLSLAIFDDLGAIIIIAVFYTDGLSFLSIWLGAFAILILIALNRGHVTKLSPYIIVGLVLWLCVLKSGVHATLAGVILGFIIPAQDKTYPDYSPAKFLEQTLHPWVAFGIVPLFAFANSGISLHGLTMKDLFSPIPLGIGLGLFFGNQIGVFSFTWVAIKTGLAKLPEKITWGQIYAVSILCGVGFTMSLFISGLAFGKTNYDLMIASRLGILIGSFLSAVVGFLVLRAILPKKA